MLPFLFGLTSYLVAMAFYKISNKSANLSSSTRINIIADLDELVSLIFVNPYNQLTIFLTRARSFTLFFFVFFTQD